HSERKRDWSSLLPTVAHDDLSADFSPAVVEAILSGAHQTLKTGDVVLSFVPMLPPHSSFSTLSLYRAIPASTLEQPVGYFRRWVFFTGVALIGVVLLLAVVAAKQFTEPILRLRDGMARLIDGTGPTALDIATNDELEDLARDFTRTAATLSEYRSRLEEALSDKTRALHRTSAELSDVLAHSADAIMALDPEGRVRIWNRGAEQLFGYSADEAVGMDADSLLLPPTGDGHDDRAFIRRELEMRGAVVNLRTRRRRRDGTIIPVSLTATVMRDESGDILGTSLIARSAEGQERLEEQMRRSERLAAASVMAAGLAHELNNPLAIIGNRLECMEQDVAENGGDQLLRQDLRVLREHTDRLRSLTRDLLRFARDEDERASEVNLNEIVRRATGLLEQSLTRAGIRLELRLDDRIPAVAAHEKAIETSYVNLLLNAADAMPSGGAVTVSTRLSVDGEAVQLAVSDTGPGVPHELRERIFQPFYTTKGAGTGTGLGLAVCRAVAERHAGEIVVEDAEGGGSRFVLSLPLRSPVRLS
ncbi:MAG: ATP-binding protein, partial [Gemmatimonadales bacterium]